VDEIKQSKPVAPKAILLEAVAKPAESTHFEPEKVAPPRIDQAAPKIEIAVPVAPPPAVAPGN
jgi:hypothetical protein